MEREIIGNLRGYGCDKERMDEICRIRLEILKIAEKEYLKFRKIPIIGYLLNKFLPFKIHIFSLASYNRCTSEYAQFIYVKNIKKKHIKPMLDIDYTIYEGHHRFKMTRDPIDGKDSQDYQNRHYHG